MRMFEFLTWTCSSKEACTFSIGHEAVAILNETLDRRLICDSLLQVLLSSLLLPVTFKSVSSFSTWFEVQKNT